MIGGVEWQQKTAKYFVFDFDEKVTKCSEGFWPRTCSSFVVGGGGLQVTLQLSHCFCVCVRKLFSTYFCTIP